jgi:hypothetical protein
VAVFFVKNVDPVKTPALLMPKQYKNCEGGKCPLKFFADAIKLHFIAPWLPY